MRVPRVNYDYDIYELSIYSGRGIKLHEQWTMSMLTHPHTGELMGAYLYNGDTNRGSYGEGRPKNWLLSLYDYPHDSVPVPPEIIRAASNKVQEILGTKHSVRHNLQQCSIEAY